MENNPVINFIDEVNKERHAASSKTAFMSSPIYKKRKLDENMTQAKDQCLQYIFADLYKNSLPLDDSYIDTHDEKLSNDMKDFINRQTADRGVDCYVREAIKRGNHSLEEMVESVDALVKNCFREKCEDYKKIDPKDLDWKFGEEQEDALKEIAKDANLDEVANYVKRNVEGAVNYAKAKIQERRDTTKDLQDSLNNSEEVTNEAAVVQYLKMNGQHGDSTVYTPSLFEAVMIHTFNHNDSENAEEQENCYNEAVGEFTMLNINKALRYKDYSLADMRNLAREYARA